MALPRGGGLYRGVQHVFHLRVGDTFDPALRRVCAGVALCRGQHGSWPGGRVVRRGIGGSDLSIEPITGRACTRCGIGVQSLVVRMWKKGSAMLTTGKAVKVTLYLSDTVKHHGVPVYTGLMDFLFRH